MLKEHIESHAHIFFQQAEILKSFVKSFSKFFTEELQSMKEEELDEESRIGMGEIVSAALTSQFTVTIEPSSPAYDITKRFLFNHHGLYMLLSMATVHSFALLEEQLKKVAETVLKEESRILLGVEKKMSYREMFSCKDMSSLQELAIQKDISSEITGGLKSYQSYFKKRLSVDISSFSDWDDLNDAAKLRNLIVHNGGVVDGKYCKEMGLSGVPEGSQVQLELPQFLNNMQLVEGFVGHVIQLVESKYC